MPRRIDVRLVACAPNGNISRKTTRPAASALLWLKASVLDQCLADIASACMNIARNLRISLLGLHRNLRAQVSQSRFEARSLPPSMTVPVVCSSPTRKDIHVALSSRLRCAILSFN